MITIQVVLNSDRCHVCLNGVPVKTFLFSNFLSNYLAEANAKSFAYNKAIELQNEDFKIEILPDSKEFN